MPRYLHGPRNHSVTPFPARSRSEPPTRLPLSVSPAKPLSIFYGYPAELVARWCAVSLRTANSYKLGTRKPSRQSLRLFAMHRDGKVLTDDWDGWSVHKGSLVDPDGNSTTRNQLRAYWLVMQLAAELANRNPADRRLYDDILRLA
jgi:hypothetical protein